MIGIVDFGLGNLFSIEKAFNRLGKPFIISDQLSALNECSHYILSGVGHYRYAMEQLEKANLISFLRENALEKKKPILGICLGMQLLADSSEEGNVDGLKILPGKVIKLQIPPPYKIPHIGWNTLDIITRGTILQNISSTDSFYFSHSYAYPAIPENVLAVTNYGGHEFVSVIGRANILGVQFHPEKSFEQGLTILKNFTNS